MRYTCKSNFCTRVCFSIKPHLLSQQRPRVSPNHPRWRISVWNYTFSCTIALEQTILSANKIRDRTQHFLPCFVLKSFNLWKFLWQKKKRISVMNIQCHDFGAPDLWQWELGKWRWWRRFCSECQMSFSDLIWNQISKRQLPKRLL